MMFIVSKDRKSIINANHVVKIFISAGDGIQASYTDGTTYFLGKYKSMEAANAAMRILTKWLSEDNCVIRMPDDRDVEHSEEYFEETGREYVRI